MKVNRRTILTWVAGTPALIAGCGGSGSGGAKPTPTPSPSPTPTVGRYTVTDVTIPSLNRSGYQYTLLHYNENGLAAGTFGADGGRGSTPIVANLNSRTHEEIIWQDDTGFLRWDIGTVYTFNNKGEAMGTIRPEGTNTTHHFHYDYTSHTITIRDPKMDRMGSVILTDNGDFLDSDADTNNTIIYKPKGSGTYDTITLPKPPGTNSCTGAWMNNSGHVVGTVRNTGSGGQSRAFLWKGGEMELLPQMYDNTPELERLTDGGRIIGRVKNLKNRREPYYWQDGNLVNLPLPDNFDSTYKILANDRNEVLADLGNQVVLWTNGEREILTDLIPSSAKLLSVHPVYLYQDGRILVRASVRASGSDLFMLTPR